MDSHEQSLPTEDGGMATRSPVSRGRLRWLSLRSLRARLVVVVLAMNSAAAVLIGSVVVWQARTATRLEIGSSLQLADGLAQDAIQLMQGAPAPAAPQLRDIQLGFQSLRHVHITVSDRDGQQLDNLPAPRAPADAGSRWAPQLWRHAPAWFRYLVAPAVESREFPVVVRGEWQGRVVVTTEPEDEVDEAWDYACSTLASYVLVDLAMLAALFLLFGRVLAPLTNLASGLKKIVDGNYDVRLPVSSLLELDEITRHFNAAAEALASTQRANHDLNRRLLTASDDERRRTALELHDEAGPCLFALEAAATSISRLKIDGTAAEQLRERADEVVKLVGQVQAINRRVLDRLRPMALGRIPLRDNIIKLVAEFDTGALIEHAIGEVSPTYGPLLDLTFYRCSQEGLFNAVRHAQASRIWLTLRDARTDAGGFLALTIRDNGKGIPRVHRQGIGLEGMRERVEALRGSFEIQSSPRGTTLNIVLPTGPVVPQVAVGPEAVPA